MVDTMALLPPFIRGSRMPRKPSRHASGLPADDEVLLDAPDDRLGLALVAAARGEYGPGSALLTATRASADWENRDRYARRLAAFARSRDEWYEAWRTAAPHDPDALLVGAQLAVDRVWRSPARAEMLREVSPLITAAGHGDLRDPVPWRIALDHARGSNAGHKYFEELWEAAVRRAPHHYGCHVAAMRYLASSSQGSLPACFDFAELAAHDAPADSLVQALPARAAFACLTAAPADGSAGSRGPEVTRERLDAAADRAIALSARFPAADPWPAEVRNKLMYVLVRLERWTDAAEQLHQIGPYATSFPWDRFSDDPLAGFLEIRHEIRDRIRDETRRRTPSPHPRSEHGERARSGDH
ncbi:hypothetical protein OG604_11950 [Streptomyces sp. NBC_01231]|nr:hypothetical protein OG604_11950 [Streptomyces sp. NBC_01231]